jgi:hypothetical protein
VSPGPADQGVLLALASPARERDSISRVCDEPNAMERGS